MFTLCLIEEKLYFVSATDFELKEIEEKFVTQVGFFKIKTTKT